LNTKVDVAILALFGKKGTGKTTLSIALGVQYSLANGRAPIFSNIALSIPGIETVKISHVNELLQECNNDPCTCLPRITIVDEFDKSFTSHADWMPKEREQMLVQLVSNIRKHNTIAFIATSQLRKKIKNDYRHNCDFVMEPTGTLDSANCPEYFIWSDVELYEESGKARYKHAEFCSALFPLEFLERTFNTRQVIPLEWS
jgi:hypothetical protein